MKQIYVMGCGPSIKDTLPYVPKDAIIFGCGNAWKYTRLDYWTSVSEPHYRELMKFHGDTEEGTGRMICMVPSWIRGAEFIAGRDTILHCPNGSYLDLNNMNMRFNSGCVALQMAVGLGYTRITLIGIDGPTKGGRQQHPPHYWSDPERKQHGNASHREQWEIIKETIDADRPDVRVRDWSNPGYFLWGRKYPEDVKVITRRDVL